MKVVYQISLQEWLYTHGFSNGHRNIPAEQVPTKAIYDMSFEDLEDIFEIPTDSSSGRRLSTSEFNFDNVMIQVKRSSIVQDDT